jgi:hypothetical protein
LFHYTERERAEKYQKLLNQIKHFTSNPSAYRYTYPHQLATRKLKNCTSIFRSQLNTLDPSLRTHEQKIWYLYVKYLYLYAKPEKREKQNNDSEILLHKDQNKKGNTNMKITKPKKLVSFCYCWPSLLYWLLSVAATTP